MNRSACAFICGLLLTLPAFGQSDYLMQAGSPPFATNLAIPGGGFVNITNGNLHIEIPITNPKQRGSLPVDARLVYDSRIWQINDVNGVYSWQPNNISQTHDYFASPSGWRFVIGQQQNDLWYYITLDRLCHATYQFGFTDSVGTIHTFPFQIDRGCGGTQPNGQGYASDGSGYFAVSNGGNTAVYDSQGNQVTPTWSSPCSPHCSTANIPFDSIDTNGNYTSTDANSNFIDTLGRTPVQISTSGNTTTYSVLIPGGGRTSYTVTSTTASYSTGFNQSGVSDVTGTMQTIQSIGLPDGSSYSFVYEPGYGELSSMRLPQGGIVTFGWSTYFDSYNNANRWLTSSQLGSAAPTTYAPQVISQCSQNGTGCQEQVTVTKPSGDQTVYTMTIENGAWNTETQYYNGSVGPNNLLATDTAVENYVSATDPTCMGLSCGAQPWNSGQTTTRTFPSGDQTGSVSSSNIPWTGLTTTTQQWNFAAPMSGAPTRQTVYQYTAGPNFSNLLQYMILEDGNGIPVAQTYYGYDDFAVTSAGTIPQHEAVSGSRGNLTTVTNGNAALGGASTTTYTYDDAGSIQSQITPNGNASSSPGNYQTTYHYDPTDTYVTQVTAPPGYPITTSAEYDPSTGAITRSDDANSFANGKAYSLNYQYDSIGRLYTITRSGPDGGQTTYTYPSSAEIDVAVQQSPGSSVTTQNLSDEFGRPLSSTQNGIVSSVSYDDNGRVYCRFHPASTSGGSSTDGSECTTYDGLDRISIATHNPSGAKITSNYDYQGQGVTVTDELNHTKSYTVDGFGRTTSVTEPNGNMAGYLTRYTYDLMDNLVQIDQEGDQQGNSSQWRSYKWNYDARGRLISKYSPEAGTTCYGAVSEGVCTALYDADGNAQRITDERGAYVTYQYDPLDRVTYMTSAGNTCPLCPPDRLTFIYDSPETPYTQFPIANGAGRLVTALWDNAQRARITYFGYNTRGELTTESGCMYYSCQAYQVSATYDQAGNLTSLTYPDQRTIQNSYDLNNRLNSVSYSAWQGQATPGNPAYWHNAVYTPTGRLLNAMYGSGLALSAQYDSRSQFGTLQYSASPPAQSLWSKVYSWDVNAKNVTAISDPIANTVRQFGYDTLDRLTTVVDLSSASTPATGTAVVDGSEGTHLVCDGAALSSSSSSSANTKLGTVNPDSGIGCQRFTDSGTVTITVNGFQAIWYFGQSDTSSTVASGLTAALNAPNSPVTAVLQSATTIQMTSKTTGQGANYAISWSGTTDGTVQDFTVTLSGNTLTGGGNGVPLSNPMNETYAYDPWGNMTKTGNYTFSPVGFNALNQANDCSVIYDFAGNIVSDNLNHDFSYSALGKLAYASNFSLNLEYDALGRRVGAITGSSDTEFAYLGDRLVAVNGPSGWTDLIYANDQVIADVAGTQSASPSYRILNHLGSVEALVDNNNAVIGTADYFPDGRAFVSSLPTPFGFTGLYGGSPGDTSHADSRELYGTEGRWLSPDPTDSSFHMDDPQSFNRYSYVRGSMLSRSDRSGLDGVQCGSVCIGIGDGLAGLCFIFCGGGPAGHFSGSMIRRANAGKVWEENGTQIAGIPNPGIGGLLNLPQTGCEFGGCTDAFGPGGGNQDPHTQGLGLTDALKIGAIAASQTAYWIWYHTSPVSCFYTRGLESTVGTATTALGGASTSLISRFGPYVGVSAAGTAVASGVGDTVAIYGGYAYIANRTVCKKE